MVIDSLITVKSFPFLGMWLICKTLCRYIQKGREGDGGEKRTGQQTEATERDTDRQTSRKRRTTVNSILTLTRLPKNMTIAKLTGPSRDMGIARI